MRHTKVVALPNDANTFSELEGFLGRAAKEHRSILITHTRHPAQLLNDIPPAGPRIIQAGGADGPVAAEHDAVRAKGGQDDAEPAKGSLKDLVGGLVPEAGGHLGETAGELHVGVGALGEGVDCGAPGDEGGIAVLVEDAEVGFGEMVCSRNSSMFFVV